MKLNLVSKVFALAATTAMVATPVLAEKAAQLVDINGMDAWGAERALKSRGFRVESTHKNSRGYTYSYWWDRADDKCVRVEVYNDTVQSIVDATDQDCGHHKGDTAAAVGAVAGLAILGGLLASKSHHRDDKDYDERQTNEFDRGYKDGLYNSPYHNYSRSDAYSHGYEKGVDEREANLSHHHRRGGYAQVAQFKDLVGAQASSADGSLRSRGFNDVDAFRSGSTLYTIWYNANTRQCLQMTVANGSVYSMDDIRTHPKCHGGGGSSSSAASSPAQYRDVIGRSGSRARDILGDRGFTRVARFGDDNTRYSIMWRPQSRQCLQLMIVDGRASDIRDIQTHPNCR